MKKLLFGALMILSVVPRTAVFAQAALSTSDFRSVTDLIERDFGSIDNIYTVSMSDHPDGRFDLIVLGGKPRVEGWRAEVITVRHHKPAILWDSAIGARGDQYSNAGPETVTINTKNSDYELLIQTCAQHMCHDGVSGFVAFFGQSERAVTATVVTRGIDKPVAGEIKYDVTFSKNADPDSRAALEKVICRSPDLSNKFGLPFSCRERKKRAEAK